MNELDQILYLDDEEANLEVFKAFFSGDFNVHIAENSKIANAILSEHPIKVLISDQRMPDISGIDFILQVKEKFPEIMCIMLTAYPDNDVLMSSINKANVYRFMVKPWQEFDMTQALHNAIQAYNAREERQKLIYNLQVAQEKAVESDKLKKIFLSNVSHELRTPLNGILGFLSLLEMEELNKAKVSEYLKIIQNSSNQLITVIDDIVKASEIQAGGVPNTMTKFDLNKFFDSISKRYQENAQSKGVNIVISGITDEYIVTTDRTKLYEIFNQLMSNALKFTQKGTIEFGIRHEESEVFFVKDTGVGIAPQYQSVIFQTFHQGAEIENNMNRFFGGNGLGLSIAKGLIDMAGGKIWLESELGKGSCFSFTFPFE